MLNHIEPPAPSSEDMAMRVNAYWRIWESELRRYSKGSEHCLAHQREDGA
ncbi:MAG: hypothetical protein R2748_33255 [Bryobacterales bacterium]